MRSLPLDVRVPPPQAARDLVAVALGARENSLAAGELLGTFLLLVRAPNTVDHAGGPRALAPGHRLGVEVAEAPHGLHHPQLAEGEAARGMV